MLCPCGESSHDNPTLPTALAGRADAWDLDPCSDEPQTNGWLMPAFSEAHATARNEFYQVCGHLMLVWAELEEILLHWFMTASGMDQAKARAVFYSAKSFNGRADMLKAVIPLGPFDEATVEFIKAGLKKARQFSGFRNLAAHGAEEWRHEEADPPTYVLADPRIRTLFQTKMLLKWSSW